MSEAVVPTIRPGGVDTVYVMPNLTPPVTTVAQALAYRDRLRAIDDSINYLMTLFLDESITPDVVREAKAAGIAGIKSYPKGTTTNSAGGVLSFEGHKETLRAMEECDLVLNIHGEVPTGTQPDISVMNAESRFLPTLLDLHRQFPRLRIVLEHVTTADAVEAVRACGDTVRGTITAHHLSLVIDHAVGDVFCYCKPVAKSPEDRAALLNALVTSGGKFFLGTDSAPHDISAKKGKGSAAAGVFTQPFACQYILTALEEGIERGDIRDEQVTEEVLEGFLGAWGREFYRVEQSTKKIVLRKADQVIPESLKAAGVEVVNYRAGKKTWSLEWS
ncbi:hypothetical protein ACRALDRAFT_1044265 [Sodiomyces alcalophilus JCM 7366]|uniref:uncharacterized protein n=1 Tax=Sodiomyces alcalophilus JCM 7366 TaxID=591952 RepID=UPI0039B5068C